MKSVFFRLGFTSKQLQRLYARFQELQKGETRTEFLKREDLLSIREVSANPLGQRLVDVIIEDHGNILSMDVFLILNDLGENNRINFRQFAKTLSRFRRGKVMTNLNTKEEKLLFLFSVRLPLQSTLVRIVCLDLRSKS